MGTVTANGVRFSYLEQGSGPLVLFIHGFPDTAYTWDATMAAVAAAGYRCVAPFTRGYAPTEVPADGKYDTETLGNDVLALIDALGADRAVVVGHDWGASGAYAAASLAPEKVRLMVTVAIPHPRSIKPGPILAWKVRHFVTLKMKNAEAKLRKNDFAMIDKLVARWAPAWDVPKGETDRVKAAFSEPGCLDAALGYYRQLTFSPPPVLRKDVTIPAVAFAGENDIIAPRIYEKARHCFKASYEVVQMPGGHFMHREHPEHFSRELVRVLRDKAPV